MKKRWQENLGEVKGFQLDLLLGGETWQEVNRALGQT